MKTKIYALRDEDRWLRYVGKTGKPLPVRLIIHLREAQAGVRTHKCNWIRSMLRHDLIPTITLIEEVEGGGNDEERKWIKYFYDHGIELVNGTDGGDGGNTILRFSPEEYAEFRKKCSHQATDEYRKNMSRIKKGHPVSQEQRQKLSIANKGQIPWMKGKHPVLSEEHKMNISKAIKGKHWFLSEETKRKMSIAKKGKPSWHKGKRRSEETKKRMSASARKRKKQAGRCYFHIK